MENSYYNHANRAYFLCKSYLFVKFFVIFLFIANVTLANGNGTSELYDIKKGLRKGGKEANESKDYDRGRS